VAADKINIQIDVETRAAIAELAKIEKATREVEKETKKLTLAQAAWKAANTDLGQLTKGWRDAGEVFAKVGLAFAGVTAAGVAFAAHIEQQNRAVSRLGPAYHAVTAATNGVITATQALTLQGQIQAAGVQVNERAMAALTRQAREWADATGNDASQAIEKLTNAVVNNSEDALSEMNLAMARGSTSAQTLANMVRELEARFQGVSPPARTLQQDLEKLPQALEAIGAAALQTANGPLETLFNGFMRIGGALAGINVEGMTFRRSLSEIANAGDDIRALQAGQADTRTRDARRQSRDRLIATLNRRGMRIDLSSAGGLQGLSGDELTQLASAAESARSQANLDSFVSGIGAQRSQDQSAATRRAGTTNNRVLTDMEAAVERKTRKTSETSAADPLRSVTQQYNRAIAAAIVVGAPIVNIGERAAGQTAAEYWQARVTAQELSNRMQESARTAERASAAQIEQEETAAAADARTKSEAAFSETRAGVERGRERTQRRAARDRETRSQALQQDRSLGGGMLRGLGVTGDALETESKLMQGYSDMAVGALSKIGDAFTKHIELVLSGQETIGQALLAGTNEVSLALAREALPRSLMELAAGFAALANPLTVATAPAHFTAAAIYGGVAAGAGLVAGVTGAAMAGNAPPGASGAANQASARAASGRSLPSGNDKAAPITLVVSSLVPPGPRELQALVNANRQAGRYGIDRKAPRQVRA